MTIKEQKQFAKSENLTASKKTAEEVKTCAASQKLHKGDIITLPSTKSPVIYEQEFNGHTVYLILVDRNGLPFKFYFSAIGRRVYDEAGEVHQSDTKLSEEYREANSLADFLKEHLSKKIQIADTHVVVCKFLNDDKPKAVELYDFEEV